MTVCDWCFITLFDDKNWIRERYKTHHTTCASWAKSLNQPCTICVALLEKIRATLGNPGKLYEDDTSPEAGQRSYSEMLLEWLETNEQMINPLMPLYQVQMQEGGARHEWLLRCVAKDPMRAPRVPTQRFVVYGAYYDGEEGREDRPPKIGNSTASEATFDQIKSWLNDCSNNHTACAHLNDPTRKKHGTFMPTRVIDVIDNRLVLSKTLPTPQTYMTLSHCWGNADRGGPSHQLTDTTLSDYLASLPTPSLPLTFQHAMTITSLLGVRYLWIDSLCIIQKQPKPKPDWTAEAPHMAKVYGNSHCNIAAVSSHNSTQGIFRPRRKAGLPPSLVRVRWSGQNVLCRVVRDDFWSGEVLGEPLYTRGWVFQERMLSPRVLHFHRKQVFWQCLGVTACESVPWGLSRVVDDERGDELRWRLILHRERKGGERAGEMERVDLDAIWRVAVRSYTACSLTFKADKLIALAGIAAAVRDLLWERYAAGMWWAEGAPLVDQLAWKVEKWYVSKSYDTITADPWRAPSWSWASLDAVVKVPARVKHEFQEYALKIQEGGVQLGLAMKGESTGPLVSGHLKVRGMLFEVKFTSSVIESRTWIWQREDIETRDEDMNGEEDVETRVSQEFCELTLDSISSLRLLQYGHGIGQSSPAENTLTCSMLLLAYETAPPDPTYRGYALAVRSVPKAGCHSRVGLVEFRGLRDKPEDAFCNGGKQGDVGEKREERITLI